MSKRIEVFRCAVCDGKFKTYEGSRRLLCGHPNCLEMYQTGKTIDQLVREASEIPKDIPNNDLDYQEFDLERMVERRDE